MAINQRALKALEYDKIIEILEGFAVSYPAKEIIRAIIPSDNFDEIIQMQQTANEAEAMILRHSSPPISPVSDVRISLKRAKSGGNLSLSELISVGAVLRISEKVSKYLKKDDSLDILNGIATGIIPLSALEKNISDSILSEEEVADSASTALFNIRKKILNTNNKIKSTLNDMIHSTKYTKYLQSPIVTMRGERYVLPVKSEFKTFVSGILHDSSGSGATLFVEPMAVVELNNDLRALAGEEKEEIEKIIEIFSREIEDNADIILADYEALLTVDCIFAKAQFSLAFKCNPVKLNKEGIVNIKQGRHPLIDKTKVVPVDIRIGQGYKTLVITGPNTGGKTVTLKTVGLFALLVQSGLNIPAAMGSEMPVFDNIFADIGDEQSIEQSLSTFSSHMVNIVEILKECDSKSLVLFDELGAGTDPEEGAALAIEILEYVKKVGAISAATTHYSEIKLYALNEDDVENACCEFDVNSLKPTYKLLIGIPGKSNAFAISKRLGLSQNIIDGAAMRMSSDSVKFEDVVIELQKHKEEAERARKQAEEYEESSKRKLLEGEKLSEKLKAEERKIIDKARQEALTIIEETKEEMALLLKEAQKLALSTNAKETNKQIEEIRKSLKSKGDAIGTKAREEKAKNALKASDIKLGATVEIISLGDKGNVITLPNNSGDLEIQAGIMKIKTNLRDIMLVNNEPVKIKTEGMGRGSLGIRSMAAKTELDLRGNLADEAILKTDKFIDDASLAGLKKISVIHGKGTGALRNAIHQNLRSNKTVKSFRLGTFGEGDSGITIIELK